MHIAVIGSGIVGLTTSLEIQQLAHSVTIYADSLPTDEKSTRFTSPWAGAHHVSNGNDPWMLSLERETFKRLWDLSAEDSDEARCLMRSQMTDFCDDDMSGKTNLEHMPNFRPLAQDELVQTALSGVTFKTVTIDTLAYLPCLLARFLSCGGRICRAYVQHIDQVLLGSWGTPRPDALVVCAGIGARSLGGVEDRDVYPIRGQTVRIRAPWVRDNVTLRYRNKLTYIIPRQSGDVILGGTHEPNDWYPHPRVETGRDIMERALALMPELVPSGKLADLEALVIEHGCGLRPARNGGIRLERGMVQANGTARAVPIVYNYGHAGAGYQSSWGTARVAAELLREGLEATQTV